MGAGCQGVRKTREGADPTEKGNGERATLFSGDAGCAEAPQATGVNATRADSLCWKNLLSRTVSRKLVRFFEQTRNSNFDARRF